MKFLATVLLYCTLAAVPTARADDNVDDGEYLDNSGETITQEFDTPWRNDDSLPTQREWRKLNRRATRRPHQHHEGNHRHQTGSVLGAEGTPNIPGAAGTPNIPGAGTILSPTDRFR